MFAMRGNLLVPIALFGYIPFCFLLFAILPPRKAVIYNFIVAWLFLPMSDLPLHGFTDYNKMSAACVGVLVGAFVFDIDTILAFRPSIWDIPMFVWCTCPFISSYYNNLGPYDGLSGIAYQTTDWGLPYFIGRIYFNDLKGLRELAHGIILGGLLYVPLVWYEIRMSPQLHRIVYGYTQYEFAQSKRYGGWRPMVFMQHGLAVSMWMTTAAMTAFWLWWSKAVDRVMHIKMGWVALILFGTAAATHSVGAIALMGIALTVLWLTRVTRWSIWIILLSFGPPTWIFLRTTDLWTGRDAVEFLNQHDSRSAQSLEVRLISERVLVDRALESPIYGWTGWKLYDKNEQEGEHGVPDQMWVIAFGKYGLIGLTSMTISLLMPVLLLAWRIPVRYWSHPGAAPAAALGVLLTQHMSDLCFNAMVNPIFILCAGGLTGMAFSLRRSAQQMPTHSNYMTPAPVRALPMRPGAASA
ncbi:MAG: O-antigen ligase domain-containing protein [Tepidisphaeraceae bacterium]|jgi:hypothetical protein